MSSIYSQLARANYAREQRDNIFQQEKNNMQTLQEWLTQKNAEKAIFLDQDETLLRIIMLKDVSKLGEWAEKNVIKTSVAGHNIGILLRPGVMRFLVACNQLAPTYILTAGITQFQKQILSAVKLLETVKDVFGRDQFHRVPQIKQSILVDNLPYNSANSQAKLHAMNGGYYVKVTDWHGINPEDTALQDALPSIKKALQSSPEGIHQS